MRADDAGWSWLFAMKGPDRIGKDAMRDKVEHMREEVNVVSRRRDKFGSELLIPTTLKNLLSKERLCPISEQHNPS
jgi:hypothetical protein